jgi:uncharacterized protein (TIGR02118 family)
MAKMIVMYDQPKDKEGFDKYYHEVHIPLAEKVPNLKNAGVHNVLQTMNSEQQLYLIAELEFETPEILTKSLASPEFLAVQGDLRNIMQYLNKPPVVVLVD